MLIIGSSAAGVNAAETLRKLVPEAKISLVDREVHTLYCRCLVTEIIAGRETPNFRPAEFYARNNIRTILGKKAVQLWPDQSRVLLDDGTTQEFDLALLAMGARPKALGIAGEDLKGVFNLRTTSDARNIAAWPAQRAIIVGGGLLSVKTALALHEKGIPRVCLVAKSFSLLSRQLDEVGAGLIEKELLSRNISVVYGQNPVRFLGEEQVTGIELDNGVVLATDLAVVGKGVEPNTDLLAEAGGRVGRGIAIGPFLETSVPAVFAAGDCIQIPDLLTGVATPSGLWPLAVQQGKMAAASMAWRLKNPDKLWEQCSLPRCSAAMTRQNSARIGSISFVSLGLPQAAGQVMWQKRGTLYRKLVWQEDRLVGAIMVGDIQAAGLCNWLIRTGKQLRERQKQSLLRGNARGVLCCAEDNVSPNELTLKSPLAGWKGAVGE